MGIDARVLDTRVLRRPERLAALERARLLLSASTAPVDSVARLAATAVAAPIALVTLVGSERVFLAGSQGAPRAWGDRQDAPISASFCQYVVSGDHPVAVHDARTDPGPGQPPIEARSAGQTPGDQAGGPGEAARAYLGHPVHDPSGQPVGAVCALDTVPRRWTDADTAALGDAARLIEAMLAAEITANRLLVAAAASDAVLDAAPEAFFAIDPAGHIVRWNTAAEVLFGWSAADAIGRPAIDLLVPPATRAAGREGLTRIVNGESADLLGRWLPVSLIHRGGRDVPAEVALSLVGGANGARLHAFVRDVTERRRAERFAGCEVAVSRMLGDATTVEEAGRLVLRTVAEVQGWRHAELWLAHEVGSGLRPVATWTRDGTELAGFVPRSLSAGQGLAGAAWESSEPIWVSDTAADHGFPLEYGFRLAIAVPVRSAERALGVLTFFGDDPEDRDDARLALISGVAAHVGQFVERRRAEDLTAELARSKDEFIALVGHELRTPLTSVSAYTDLLLTDDEVAPDEQREFLAIIHRNAEALRAIIDDLLDLAGLDSGYVTIRDEPVDLAGVVRDAVTAIRPAAEAKRVAVDLTMDPERAPVTGDAARLRQVIDHLLTNAVTYSLEDGHVDIRLCYDGPAFCVTVADAGIGIPPAERQKLFQRFFRGSNTRSRGIPGTGLGLAISRTIVERHRGTITVCDADTPGTTFQVRLPATG